MKNGSTQTRWPHAAAMTCLLTLTGLIGFGTAPARAQLSNLPGSRPYPVREEEIARLKGLELISEDGVAAGENFGHDANLPSRKQLDALLERAFRRNAVPLMTLNESNTAEAKPRLARPNAFVMLILDAKKGQGADTYVYRMNFDIYEPAVVSRTGKESACSVWHRSVFGSAASGGIKPVVTAEIGRLVAEFAKDYAAANPVADTARVSAEQAHWKSRLALLKPGMTREQVQNILHGTFTPRNGDYPFSGFTDFEGGSNGTHYRLDGDWMIHPWYDYHGKPYSAGDVTGPENRLLGLPSLERRPPLPSPQDSPFPAETPKTGVGRSEGVPQRASTWSISPQFIPAI